MKRYKEFFRESCTLEEEAKGICAKQPDLIDEDCPYKPAGGGACASADNNSKLKGKCQAGFQWSSKDEKCYKVGDVKSKSNTAK